MILAQVILATVLSGLVAVWVTARLGERVPPRFMQGIVIFAAGVLLAIAGFELLPHGLETLGQASTMITFVLGLLFFLLVSRLVSRVFERPQPTTSSSQTAAATPEQRASLVPVLLLGDGIHNTVDGVLIAAAFLQDPALGWTMTAAVALHEIPQEFGDYLLLVWAGAPPRRALLLNLASGACAVVGGVAGYFVFLMIDGLLPYALVISAASFVFIALIEVLPRILRESKSGSYLQQAACLLAGVMFVSALGWFE